MTGVCLPVFLKLFIILLSFEKVLCTFCIKISHSLYYSNASYIELGTIHIYSLGKVNLELSGPPLFSRKQRFNKRIHLDLI